MAEITNYEDMLDGQLVLNRLEELSGDLYDRHVEECGSEETADAEHGAWLRAQEAAEDSDALELQSLRALVEQCEHLDDWPDVTLVRDSYFEDFAQQEAEDLGLIDPKASWPNDCIDWKQAARELQMDYTAIEFGDVTYWVRD